MELKVGDKVRGHISKDGEILLRDVPVEMKKNAQLSTSETLALQFDVFPPSKPECAVDDVCHFVVNDEQVEVRLIEARPFVGENFVLCFLYSQRHAEG